MNCSTTKNTLASNNCSNSQARFNFYKGINLFELRQFGRLIGVGRPTTLKKEELIKNILAIEDGTIKPHIRKNLKGRPAINLERDLAREIYDLQKRNAAHISAALETKNEL